MVETPGARAEIDATGRRRYLTILFSDLSESTMLGGLMEAEHYAEMLSGLRRLCHEIIPKHGGRIARIQGDGMLAIFGYPEASEDDGRRATEAALELHAAIGRLSVDESAAAVGALALHSGIHAGLVFISDGDAERGRFEVLGDVPNTAARLSSLAERGEIYVSEETLGPERHFFSTSERYVVNLRGRTPPLAVYRVLGRARAQRRFEANAMRGLSPFVGRDGPMRDLAERMLAAMAGTPQCVVIAGGPGLGKTRLIEELVRGASSTQCLILRGYCESYLSAEPLQPFLQMLRTIFGLTPGMSAAEAAAAGEQALAALEPISAAARTELEQALLLATPGNDARPTAAATIAALHGLIGALAADRPLMLIVDDWQWADDASLQVLDAVRALPGRILVLVATRNTAGDSLVAGPVTTIELTPLSLSEAGQTMQQLLPDADPFIIADIHRSAGGNPLFIEELCHSAAAEVSGRPLEHRQGSAAWLNALIESRVERLPAEEAEIVRAAAVLGNVFPAWLLERITGFGEHHPLVLALAEQDLIFPAEQTGMLRFKHGITRDVVYQAVGLHQRKAMHLRVAAVLDSPGAQTAPEELYEALAYHYATGDLPTEAARYAELAGDKASAAAALDRARTQYSAALKALDKFAPHSREGRLRWCTVAQKLGMACVFDPLGLADGLAIFERGVALAKQSGDLEAIARAEYWLGYICYAKGLARQATRHCDASLTLATQIGDERLAAQVRATLGQVLTSACDYDRALGLLDTAIAAKRKQSKRGSSVAVGSAYALACKGCVLGDRGDFAQAEECFEEALDLLGTSMHQVASSVRGWISAVYLWQGRWEEALRVAEESVHIAEHVKSRQLLAMNRALGGYAEWVLTRKPEALQAVRDATSWIEARNGAFFTSLNYGWLVDGTVEVGLIDEARRHAARLFLRARQHDRIGEAMGCRALARGAARAHEFARADHYLELALRSAHVRGSPHERAVTQLCRAEIEIGRGRVEQAHAPLDAASVAFEQMAMRWHLQEAERLRARL
jgi:predicted ATPase/class 3 adenylate cyclase